jgi:hypothetical protein
VERRGNVPKCLEGTRQKILTTIYDWACDINAPNILWLSGSPGAGKSAIASTVVSTLWERKCLGSRFFFKGGDATLGDPASLWRTVAFDLARCDSVIKEFTVAVLKEGKVDLEGGDVELHFKYLIQEPLGKNCDRSSTNPIVVVVDGLDECGLDGSPQRKFLLRTLKDWSRLPPAFKLLVTSRDEHDIHNSLQNISQHVVLPTGELAEPEASHDISFFFQKGFAEITESYRDSLLPSWPGVATIELLTKRSAGLFIWAQTVMRLMLEGGPEDQLALVVDGNDEGINIDELYKQILVHSFGKVSRPVFDAFKTVVGAVLLAKTPLHRGDLKCLLRGAPVATSMDFILNKLSSVISTGESDNLLRISHQSFADFLTDPKRCPESFVIDREKQNLRLTQFCIRVMIHGLKFNICHLDSSHLFNDDVSDLSRRVQAEIPPHLSYSCRFWGQHLQGTSNAGPEAQILLSDIKCFLQNHILYWLEVLSLIKEVAVAVPALISAVRWIQVGFSMLCYTGGD